MTEIIVRVHDERKADLLRELLASLDFVDIVESKSDAEEPLDRGDTDFFAFAGIWEGRQVDIDLIRQQAWPRQ